MHKSTNLKILDLFNDNIPVKFHKLLDTICRLHLCNLTKNTLPLKILPLLTCQDV